MISISPFCKEAKLKTATPQSQWKHYVCINVNMQSKYRIEKISTDQALIVFIDDVTGISKLLFSDVNFKM